MPEAPDRPNTEIRPYRIEIPQVELDHLRDRLAGTRWPGDARAAVTRYRIVLLLGHRLFGEMLGL